MGFQIHYMYYIYDDFIVLAVYVFVKDAKWAQALMDLFLSKYTRWTCMLNLTVAIQAIFAIMERYKMVGSVFPLTVYEIKIMI